MARWLKVLKSPWTVILIGSVLLFTFWGGPVFTAPSLSQGGRLLVSYLFIPVAVAAVLLWKREWSWVSMGYYTLGLALIKMVITMGVHLWVIPRGARVDARAVDASRHSHAGPLYTPEPVPGWGTIRIALSERAEGAPTVALLGIRTGKVRHPVRRPVRITAGGIAPTWLVAGTLDSLLITNETAAFHTFALADTAGQLLQAPLPPGGQIARALLRPGLFTSFCTEGHPDETMQVLVFPHPYYASSSGEGAAVLDSVPEGLYRIGVWHGADRSPDTLYDVRVIAGDTTSVSWPRAASAET